MGAAAVVELRESGKKVVVQQVPRIDLALVELKAESRKLGPKSEAALEYKEKIAKRAKIRPLLRMVQSWDEGTAKGGELTRKRFLQKSDEHSDVFENEHYSMGFVFKEVRVDTLQTADMNAAIDELQGCNAQRAKRERGDDDRDLDEVEDATPDASVLDETMMGLLGASTRPSLFKGDKVCVIEGDLTNLTGTIVTAADQTGKLTLQPFPVAQEGGLPPLVLGNIELMAVQAGKYVDEGDKVRVINGVLAGETGRVVHVE